jgi:hypothetical protein
VTDARPVPVPALVPDGTLTRALLIADRAVVCDIECHGLRVPRAPGLVYDVSAMVSTDEQCPESLDLNTQALDYAEARRLITRRPQPGGGLHVQLHPQPHTHPNLFE